MEPVEKSIEKYPELVAAKNKEEYTERLMALFPELPAGVTRQQQAERVRAIVDLALQNPFQTEAEKLDLRNQTWEANHRQVIAAIHRLVIETGRMPSTVKLARETGLSHLTIRKHLQEFHLSEGHQQQLQAFRLLSTQVVAQLFQLAMGGDVKAARIYLDAVGGLPGLAGPNPAVPANNFIQINNAIRIDQLTFIMLPASVQQQITELVLQGLQATLLSTPEGPNHTPPGNPTN